MNWFRWMGVACVAVAGLVLAFTAGVWCVKTTERRTAEAVATEAKPTANRVTTQTTTKPDSRDEEKRSVKPPPPIREANDPPKSEPVRVVPLPPVVFPGGPASPKLPPVTPELPSAPAPVPLPPVASLSDPLVLPPDTSDRTPQVPKPGVTPIEAPSVVPIPGIAADSTSRTPPVQYLNKPEVEFEYELETKGKSGVKSVTLYVRDPAAKNDMPQDQKDAPMLPGRTWTAAHKTEVKEGTTSKLRWTMPQDGLYEFRLGVVSGNGNASTPTPTDPADLVVVYDTKPPVIESFTAKLQPRGKGLVVQFECVTTDPNLHPVWSVYIEYRAAEGEWRSVKREHMTWAVPDDAPAEVAVRVSVIDQAGNVTTKTIDKLNLDPVVPVGKLTKVRAVAPAKKVDAEPTQRLIPVIDDKE